MSAGPPRQQPLARLTLFDLDHTLLQGDSDVLWCEFLMDQGHLPRARFAQRSAAMEQGYRNGSISVQEFSGFFISTLAGRTRADWQPLREQFLREVIAPRLPAAAHALVRGHLQAGDLVVLSTATNRFITELTARHLGIAHVIATECEMTAPGDSQHAEASFTGRPLGTPNMREGKVERLHAWLAERGQWLAQFRSRFYSDSHNDLPLLQAVNEPVAVDADERVAAIAAQRGWPRLSLRSGGA